VTLTVWGSDYYRLSPQARRQYQQLTQAVDRISCANKATIASLQEEFALPAEKLYHCRFGLTPIESIQQIAGVSAGECKERLGIAPQTPVVACGYNGRPEQRHLAVLESLVRARPQLPDDMLVLVPVAYGGTPEYVDEVDRAFAGSGLAYRVCREFLSDADVAVLRKATDVMIQVQPTDQLSGCMTEQIFAGGMVITGNWLPYGDIRERGVTLLTVDDVEDVGAKLATYWADRNEYTEALRLNPERIYPLVSWDANIQSWIDFFRFPDVP
jgi:hypothetical protein